MFVQIFEEIHSVRRNHKGRYRILSLNEEIIIVFVLFPSYFLLSSSRNGRTFFSFPFDSNQPTRNLPTHRLDLPRTHR